MRTAEPHRDRDATARRPRAPVRVVTFDLWRTLLFDRPGDVDFYTRYRIHHFQRILRTTGVSVSTSRLGLAYAGSSLRLDAIWRRRRDVPVRTHVLTILRVLDPRLAEGVSPSVIEALSEEYARPAIIMPPAVHPAAAGVLAALQGEGYVIALISNTLRTPGSALRAVLARAGLLHYFAHTTFSDEARIRKPEARIFLRTLEALDASPHLAIHVGDDPVLDVEGALGAGLRAVHVSPPDRAHPRAAASVPDLAAVPDAVAALRS